MSTVNNFGFQQLLWSGESASQSQPYEKCGLPGEPTCIQPAVIETI